MASVDIMITIGSLNAQNNIVKRSCICDVPIASFDSLGFT